MADITARVHFIDVSVRRDLGFEIKVDKRSVVASGTLTHDNPTIGFSVDLALSHPSFDQLLLDSSTILQYLDHSYSTGRLTCFISCNGSLQLPDILSHPSLVQRPSVISPLIPSSSATTKHVIALIIPPPNLLPPSSPSYVVDHAPLLLSTTHTQMKLYRHISVCFTWEISRVRLLETALRTLRGQNKQLRGLVEVMSAERRVLLGTISRLERERKDLGSLLGRFVGKLQTDEEIEEREIQIGSSGCDQDEEDIPKSLNALLKEDDAVGAVNQFLMNPQMFFDSDSDQEDSEDELGTTEKELSGCVVVVDDDLLEEEEGEEPKDDSDDEEEEVDLEKLSEMFRIEMLDGLDENEDEGEEKEEDVFDRVLDDQEELQEGETEDFVASLLRKAAAQVTTPDKPSTGKGRRRRKKMPYNSRRVRAVSSGTDVATHLHRMRDVYARSKKYQNCPACSELLQYQSTYRNDSKFVLCPSCPIAFCWLCGQAPEVCGADYRDCLEDKQKTSSAAAPRLNGAQEESLIYAELSDILTKPFSLDDLVPED